MKKLLHTLFSILESMGRAKAAAHLARAGRNQEAQALMLGK